MYYLKSILIVINLLFPPEKPVTDAAVMEAVQSSLCSGNAGRLADRFAQTPELVIDSEQVEFAAIEASHAEQIMRTFFRKHPPHRFTCVLTGASDRFRYCTGTYESNGQAFAVYVLLRQADQQQFVVDALHFRKV